MKWIFCFLLFLLFISCDINKKSTDVTANTSFSMEEVSVMKIAIPDELAYKSYFDSDHHLLELKLYKLDNNEWKIFQVIDSIWSQMGEDSLEIMDFNFDGSQDFRLSVGTAARGANEYYDIFVRNAKTNNFHKINRYNISNLRPDSSKKIISAVRYFSNKTVFEEYTLKEDSLKILNKIEVQTQGNWTHRHRETYNQFGNTIEEKIDSIKDFGESVLSPKSR